MKNEVLKGATGVGRRKGVTFVKWNPSARSQLSPEVNEDCVGGTVIFQHDTCCVMVSKCNTSTCALMVELDEAKRVRVQKSKQIIPLAQSYRS